MRNDEFFSYLHQPSCQQTGKTGRHGGRPYEPGDSDPLVKQAIASVTCNL